jgi:hypothetical protein
VRRRQLIRLLVGAALWPLQARAQNQPASDQNQPGQDQADQPAADDSIGQVSTVQGNATVTRAGAAAVALKASDPIYKSDVLATGASSSLGVTFDDETTFSLSANSRIVVDEFVYQEGGSGNSAAYNVARGTVAFVASQVAKTGNMTITTPTATMGIRGTTGIVDVPDNAGGGGEAKVKLYPDADGRIGQIEVFDRQGGRLGALTQGASAFSIRPGAGGRFAAVPFRIPPQEAARDRGVVQRLFAAHNVGRRMTVQRRQQQRGRTFRAPNNPRQQNQRRPNGPPQPNRNPNPRQQQQPNRGPGQAPPRNAPNGAPQQRSGVREQLRKLNPFKKKPPPEPR